MYRRNDCYRFDSMEYEDMAAKQMYNEIKSRLYKKGKTYLFWMKYRRQNEKIYVQVTQRILLGCIFL